MNINLEQYTLACQNFSNSSKDWGNLDSREFYTTSDLLPYWVSSCDNAHGGLSVKWAFKKSMKFISDNAESEFQKEIKLFIDSIED